MRCTKCGAEIGDNEKFCSVCGTPVNGKAKAVNDDTLSDDKTDTIIGSGKQNSDTQSARVKDDTFTGADTTGAQSNIIVSDVTVEEFTMPDETISDDTIIGDSKKKKVKAKEPDEIAGVKNKKKEKEPKEEKPKKDKPEKVKENKEEKSAEPAKSETNDKTKDKKDENKEEKKSDKPEDKSDKSASETIAADKKEGASSPVRVEYIQVDDKLAGNASDYDTINDTVNDDKVIKINKDTKDIQLTVTKTTTISEEIVKSDGDDKTEYEIKQEPEKEKHISVAGKNLTFVQSNQFSLARDDKHLSPGARANIERRKAEAAEALKRGKSDEERINDAVKAIKESVIRNGKEGWICRVCGHYNPSTTTACLKCGRDRVRMAKLKARGYDPNAVPKLVQRKKRVRPKKERIVYLQPDKKEEVQESGAPVVHNFIYTGARQQVLFAKDPYVTVEHPIRNRILASVCTLLMLLFICISLFATAYISTDGSVIKGFNGIEIISAVLVGLFGGTKDGSKYFDLFQKEITTNGWIIGDTGLLNQRAFAGLLAALILLALVSIALADFIRCIIRIVKGRPMKGRFHILALLILVGVCSMFLFIWMHNTFAFYQEGSAAFWGHQPDVTVTLDGMTITDAVYSTGIAYILTFFFILARFIIGFFFAKPERMKLSEASERYPNTYPQKYYEEHTEISPEDYEVIMRNAGAVPQPVPPVQEGVTVQRTTTTETVSTFDQPVTFAAPPPPPSHMDVKTQTFTTYSVPEKTDKPVVAEYTVTTKMSPDGKTETTQTTTTQDLDNGREKSKKEGK